MSLYHLSDHEVTFRLDQLNPYSYVLANFEVGVTWYRSVSAEGFRIMRVDEWLSVRDDIMKSDYLNVSVGINLELDYSPARDVLEYITVYELNDNQAYELQSVFPYGFGVFPEVEYLEEEDN